MEAATERGPHSSWEEDMVEFSGKGCEKLFLYSIFILFDASFSLSVTKLYPIRNRDVSTTTEKS